MCIYIYIHTYIYILFPSKIGHGTVLPCRPGRRHGTRELLLLFVRGRADPARACATGGCQDGAEDARKSEVLGWQCWAKSRELPSGKDGVMRLDHVWLVVIWNMAVIFPYIGNNHPN